MTNKKIRVGLIFGGRSGEHEVSLMSARSVLKAIDREKYEVTLIGITPQGKWVAGGDPLKALTGRTMDDVSEATLLGPAPGHRALMKMSEDPQHRGVQLSEIAELDVVLPLLHGTFGEDGTVQGLLELLDLPYVGAGVLGSSLGMDKGLFKDVMRANNIPVVDSFVALRREIEQDLEDVLIRAEGMSNYPIFTKPANLGSSVGITKAHDLSELAQGLHEAARYDRRVLVERGLDRGREIEVSVLGNDAPIASVVGEVVPGDEFYTYAAKYIRDDSKLLIPAPISPELAEEAQRLAVAAFRAIDCAGMARCDFLLERETGFLYLSEINTIPGFTQISMYPKLWEASGISYTELLDRLIGLALERQADKDQTVRSYEATS